MENLNKTEGQNPDKLESIEQMEKDLNEKILKITMTIEEHYPELTQFLEEMPETVPSENDPEITLNHLKLYYESLKSLVKNYQVESPNIDEQVHDNDLE
jgi:adenylate kinase family enzyme